MGFSRMLMIVKAKTNDFLGVGDGRRETNLRQRPYLPRRFLRCCQHVDSRAKPTELLTTEAKDLARGNPARTATCRNQPRRLRCGARINRPQSKEDTNPQLPPH